MKPRASSDSYVAALARHYPWWQALSPRSIETILARGRLLRVPANTQLFAVGASCDGLPLVVSGSIAVSRYGPTGREILLYRVASGDTCALSTSCLLGASPYTAAAYTETETTLLQLPPEVFLSLLDQEAEFRHAIFSQFAERLAELMALVDAVTFRRLDERLAAHLLGRGSVVKISHAALARELGSVREIVSRILSQFADRGWIRQSRGRIEILAPQALRSLALDSERQGP